MQPFLCGVPGSVLHAAHLLWRADKWRQMCGSLLERARCNGIDVSGQRQRNELGNELGLEMEIYFGGALLDY